MEIGVAGGTGVLAQRVVAKASEFVREDVTTLHQLAIRTVLVNPVSETANRRKNVPMNRAAEVSVSVYRIVLLR